MLKRIVLLLAVALLAVLPATVGARIACDEGTTPAASPAATPTTSIPEAMFPDDGGTLTIFAAASLTDAFAAMAASLEEAHPGLDIVIETGGSQAFVTQLNEGARADVLATASIDTMEKAVDAGLIEGTPVPFADNHLVIVAPGNNPAGIASVDDLTVDGLHLVIAGRDVPAGAYAHRALCAYAAADGAPKGFLDAVSANVVSEEQDVRSVVAKVQLGEADAGIVYASDAEAARLSGSALAVVDFPEGMPTTALYPIAPVAGGDTEIANAFIAHVLSEEGQAVLAEYGFSPVR